MPLDIDREMKTGHNHFPGYFVCKTSGSFAYSLNEFESGSGGAERVLDYSQQEVSKRCVISPLEY